MNSIEACIALNMLPTVGPVRLRKLLQVFNEPENILAAKRDQLRKVEGIGKDVADQISNWESIVDLPEELKRVKDFGATVITQNSPSYPKPLREIHAPPIVLYVWGEIQERDQHASAISTRSGSSARVAPLTMAASARKSSPTNLLTRG